MDKIISPEKAKRDIGKPLKEREMGFEQLEITVRDLKVRLDNLVHCMDEGHSWRVEMDTPNKNDGVDNSLVFVDCTCKTCGKTKIVSLTGSQAQEAREILKVIILKK